MKNILKYEYWYERLKIKERKLMLEKYKIMRVIEEKRKSNWLNVNRM